MPSPHNHTNVALQALSKMIRITATGTNKSGLELMKFKIQSRARSSELDKSNNRLKSRIIKINEVLEFDHHPTGEEIQTAIVNLPKYDSYNLQFLDTLAIQKLPD